MLHLSGPGTAELTSSREINTGDSRALQYKKDTRDKSPLIGLEYRKPLTLVSAHQTIELIFLKEANIGCFTIQIQSLRYLTYNMSAHLYFRTFSLLAI